MQQRRTGGIVMAQDGGDAVVIQLAAAQQWGAFWTGALSGQANESPRDRRFAAPEWQDDAYYRAIRDAYLLASKQLRDVVSLGEGSASNTAMVSWSAAFSVRSRAFSSASAAGVAASWEGAVRGASSAGVMDRLTHMPSPASTGFLQGLPGQ